LCSARAAVFELKRIEYSVRYWPVTACHEGLLPTHCSLSAQAETGKKQMVGTLPKTVQTSWMPCVCSLRVIFASGALFDLLINSSGIENALPMSGTSVDYALEVELVRLTICLYPIEVIKVELL